jgi:hypothetical protein
MNRFGFAITPAATRPTAPGPSSACHSATLAAPATAAPPCASLPARPYPPRPGPPPCLRTVTRNPPPTCAPLTGEIREPEIARIGRVARHCQRLNLQALRARRDQRAASSERRAERRCARPEPRSGGAEGAPRRSHSPAAGRFRTRHPRGTRHPTQHAEITLRAIHKGGGKGEREREKRTHKLPEFETKCVSVASPTQPHQHQRHHTIHRHSVTDSPTCQLPAAAATSRSR